MKQYLIFGIFLFLANKEKTTAKEIAENFEISPRSVYRYIDELSMAGLPIFTQLGRYGGIKLMKNFLLEKYVLTDKEKQTLKNALSSNSSPEVQNIMNKIIA